jgi:hypothetical protein
MPRFRITLKLAVSKIKQKVLLRILLPAYFLPVRRTQLKKQISGNLIELAPSWRNLAETALATMPAFLVRGTEAIAPTVPKAQLANVAFFELRICERI